MDYKYWSTPHTSDELMHHGVKGMKWGVRRQRKSAPTIRQKRREINKKRAQLVKNRALLSDKQLIDLNRRFQSEKQLTTLYKELSETPGKKHAKAATTTASNILRTSITTISVGAATVGGTYLIAKALAKSSNPDAANVGKILIQKLIKVKK